MNLSTVTFGQYHTAPRNIFNRGITKLYNDFVTVLCDAMDEGFIFGLSKVLDAPLHRRIYLNVDFPVSEGIAQ